MGEETIYKKLSNIQESLKVPKAQQNTFGNYAYRSCEDIVESVKPIARKYRCVITLSDKIIEVGGRVFVEATACLTDIDTSKSVEITASAREAETKKGMDTSQITGSTSSYARKYALNGLFAIDDTKDADSTNTHGKEEKNQAEKQQPKEDDKLKSFLEKVKEGRNMIGEDNYKKALDEYNTDSADRIDPKQRQNFITFMRTFKED